MKKIFPWLFVVAALAGCMQSTVKHPEPRMTMVEELEEKTIALTRADSDSDNVPYCSGVWISRDKILTANHCVESFGRDLTGELDEDKPYDSTGVRLQYVIKSDVDLTGPRNYPKKIRHGTVLAIDAEHDLALISAENIPVNHPIATVLNTQTIHDGDRVHIVGHTIGLWWTYCEGNVSSMWANIKGPTGIEVQALQISSPAWFGNSGGGAYDERGNLIGIASWVTTRAPNISFFVHHDEIVTFLQKHLKKA